MIMMMLIRLVPRTVIKTNNNGSVGITSIMSVNLIRTSSPIPPMKPAIRPMIRPSPIPIAADKSPTLVDRNFGDWVPVTGAWARLQSKSLGVQYWLPFIAGAQMHGGRELVPPDFNWAGLDYVFGPSFTGTSYVILVQAAR